jgi:hypothetical protein
MGQQGPLACCGRTVGGLRVFRQLDYACPSSEWSDSWRNVRMLINVAPSLSKPILVRPLATASVTTLSDQVAQVSPAVAAMKLAVVAEKPFSAKRLVETVGRVLGIAEQQHRSHATFYEPPGDHAEKKPPKTSTLDSLEEVNLVKFASVSWNATVRWRSLSKAHQLAAIVYDEVTKPATVLPFERLAPLSFP